MNLLQIAILLPPALFMLYGLWSKSKTTSLKALKNGALLFSGLGILTAIVSGISIYLEGQQTVSLLEMNGLGISFKIDALSIIMLGMVSFIGGIVLKYSINYLDGDHNHKSFLGRLAVTVASVQLLVISGNLLLFFLAWVSTSFALHQLLTFYKTRKKAQLAAKKKFLFARLGDFALFGAFALFYQSTGTGDIQTIGQIMTTMGEGGWMIELGAALLVMTAALKSAQLPFHGWLVEVMEAPTPVSALLHAGLLNAGPFLIIRFSHVMDAAPLAQTTLLVISGLTAMLGAMMFITQPAIKTALAYSSIAHMGFSLMASGLGAYSASLLHLVAHSFYKAHAFLSSASIVDQMRASYINKPKRKGNPLGIAVAVILAVSATMTGVYLLKLNDSTDLPLLILTGMITLGVALLIVFATDTTSIAKTNLRLLGTAALIVTAFFVWESIFHQLLTGVLPVAKAPHPLVIGAGLGLLVLFCLPIGYQIFKTKSAVNKVQHTFGVHFRNGLYLNLYLDKLLGKYHKSVG